MNACLLQIFCRLLTFSTPHWTFFCFILDFMNAQRTENVTPAIPGSLPGFSVYGGGGCVSNPCLNQGSCVSNGGSRFRCYCRRNYTGRFCESMYIWKNANKFTLDTGLMHTPLLPLVSNTQPGNGLAPVRQQAIIWTNGGIVYWHIYASLGLNELIGNARPCAL